MRERGPLGVMEWEGAGWMMIVPRRGCALVVGYELVPSESGVLGMPLLLRIRVRYETIGKAKEHDKWCQGDAKTRPTQQ